MTIPKKLLIIGALALGIQYGAQAHTSEVSYEVSQMLNFAQTLRQINTKNALKVAQWLESQACDTSYNVQDCDILAIANVINSSYLTIESKISVLSQTIATQRNAGIRRTINDIAVGAVSVAMLGCLTAIAGLIVIEEIKNPKPRPYYYAPRPRITIHHPWYIW
jgi:hypothetical protein